MLLEELAAVELLDSTQQLRRRLSRAALARQAAVDLADAWPLSVLALV